MTTPPPSPEERGEAPPPPEGAPLQADSPQAFLPRVRAPTPIAWPEVGVVALVLAVLVVLQFAPAFASPGALLLGDPDTDAIRGMWTFDHIRRSMLPPSTPIWSGEVNFPHGVLAVLLPWGSGVALSPLGAVFEAATAYNLSICVLLWAAGMATAALAHQGSESWAAGMVAGAAVASQPMLLFAVADGTPEHVAVWGIPAFLASAGLAIRRRSPPMGLLAGLLAILVASDGPYNAIFTGVLSTLVLPVALWRELRTHDRGEGLARTLVVMLGVAGIGAGILAALYGNFTLGEQEGADKARLLLMNAGDAHTWWQFDFGPDAARDPSLAPTLIPTIPLLGALLLATLRLRRAAVFVLAGLACVVLSFGWNIYLPKELAQWLGAVGTWLGQWVLTINSRVYELPVIDGVRFPRRWLVPASIAFFTAGAAGLGWVFTRLERGLARGRAVTWAVAIALALVVSQVGFRTARMHTSLPLQALPEVSFTRWLAEQPQPGAVITLPQVRAAPRSGRRGDLPVFANIAESLSSADVQYLQVLHGRPVVGYPSLKTLVPMKINADLFKLTRNWDDLAHPQTTGNPVPRSAYDDTSEPFRQTLIAWLQRQGLRYVVVDRAMYGTEGFGYLKEQLKPHTVDIQEFEDGDGVVIFVLRD